MASDAAEVIQHLRAILYSRAESLDSFGTFLRCYISSDNGKHKRGLLNREFELDKYEFKSASDEYNSGVLLVDMFQKALVFAVSKGFSCNEVFHFLTLYLHSLSLITSSHSEQQSESVTLALHQVAKDFKRAIPDYSLKLSHKHLLDSVTYITETVFQHFHLYKFLLTQDQPLDLTTVQLDLNQPMSPQQLTEGVPESEWIKKEKIASLTARQDLKERLFSEACDVAVKKEALKLQETYKVELSKVKGHSCMTENEVREIVASLSKAHLESTQAAISQVVQRHSLRVEMKTEKLELLSPRHENTQATAKEE